MLIISKNNFGCFFQNLFSLISSAYFFLISSLLQRKFCFSMNSILLLKTACKGILNYEEIIYYAVSPYC